MSTTDIYDQMLIIYQSHAPEEYKISELFFFLAFYQFMTAYLFFVHPYIVNDESPSNSK